jgi:tight adherence protein C
MELTAATVTMLSVVVVFLSLAYALSAGSSTLVGERLGRLWRPAARREPKPHFADRQKQRAGRVLEDLGKLLPPSTQAVSRTRRLLIRAGYRRPSAVYIFRGAKMLFMAVCIGSVYFTGLYAANVFWLMAAVVAGFMLPDMWLTTMMQRRQHRLRLALPDALDLMVVCVEAGLGLDQAILRVSQELRIAHPILSSELQLVNLEMRLGKSRLEALRELGDRTGVDDIKSLVAMLIQTERFGTSVAQSLRVHADTLRTQRRQRAEEQAAKAPVKMVPVLVFFIFPALFVVILGPAVITLARQLLPALGK